MTVRMDEATRELLDGKNFATVATIEPDGSPHTSVVWIARDGEAVLFSSTAGRRKVRNLARDGRIGITVFDSANPYRSIDIQGTAELVDDPDKSLPRMLSHKYLGQNPPVEPGHVRRIIVRVKPHKITGFSLPDPSE
ncbi:PPOX class F420-dependent oxidoreductase [Nocardia higoensis]|uniref:PPOX class F420-dependent oxidoreductase n=1 Tax=Nocardia higoensis TaxID=228599 RepID=A0ABS0DGK8_9NOCA|nr:PPOX class F420-dependent oxidoreductase [Nocardia higoensis]MBF6357571.1 PPOX class F420-dependent oxidoreductase [Nocardia higoensis]